MSSAVVIFRPPQPSEDAAIRKNNTRNLSKETKCEHTQKKYMPLILKLFGYSLLGLGAGSHVHTQTHRFCSAPLHPGARQTYILHALLPPEI